MKLDRFESSSAQDGRPLVVLEPVQNKYELDFLYSLKFITLKFLVITNQDPVAPRSSNIIDFRNKKKQYNRLKSIIIYFLLELNLIVLQKWSKKF